ncbi:MAG: hypothetical protein JL50_06330 [Peptococcaceae bacterium BICA1-7]|nr:MAG: hypothetical protein JL50_06330 [Peptococcaceae bacterium BICA1-7]HBV99317.1 hypothetical protein [Desulfotomaculum sp.]
MPLIIFYIFPLNVLFTSKVILILDRYIITNTNIKKPGSLGLQPLGMDSLFRGKLEKNFPGSRVEYLV